MVPRNDFLAFSRPLRRPDGQKMRRRYRRHSKGVSASFIPSTNTLSHFSAPKRSIDCNRPEDRYIALDCEMVGVGPEGKRSVLARVSMVDWDGNCLLDTFVRVEETVTDYRTAVSGIRPKDLISPSALDYGTCRRQVQELLNGKILVGHGLKNDLMVLKLSHPWYQIRDTSLYIPFMGIDGCTGLFRPQKLRTLAKYYLGRVIQEDNTEHCSVVDSIAAMDLFKIVKDEWDYAVHLARVNMFLRAQPVIYPRY